MEEPVDDDATIGSITQASVASSIPPSLEHIINKIASSIKSEPETPEKESSNGAATDTDDKEKIKVGIKRKLSSKDEKVCGVCGDKALGYNFDAISCESCKAFFRRNALKAEIPKCIFQNDCKLTINTRRFCSYCRLMKCLNIGMKKDMILGTEEKKQRLEKMMKNKGKKSSKKSSFDNQIASPASETSEASCPLSMPSTPINEDIFGSPISPPPANSPSRRLTTEEYIRISDIVSAYESTFTEIDENPSENSTLNNLVNASGVIVRRLIKFAKKLKDFVELTQDCQIWLLKGVVLSTLFLRSAEHYDQTKDAWVTPNGEIPTIVLKRATGYRELHEEHVKYCKSLKPIMQDDYAIIAMLQTISLFCPDRQCLPDREIVSNMQDKYITLLKHYLESKYSYAYARRMFPQLLGKLDELQELTENHGKVLLHVNPSEIEPLMLEVFDLK